MVLRSGRDASTRPQDKAVHQRCHCCDSNLGSSGLTSWRAVSEVKVAGLQRTGRQRSSTILEPDLLPGKSQSEDLANNSNLTGGIDNSQGTGPLPTERENRKEP